MQKSHCPFKNNRLPHSEDTSAAKWNDAQYLNIKITIFTCNFIFQFCSWISSAYLWRWRRRLWARAEKSPNPCCSERQVTCSVHKWTGMLPYVSVWGETPPPCCLAEPPPPTHPNPLIWSTVFPTTLVYLMSVFLWNMLKYIKRRMYCT